MKTQVFTDDLSGAAELLNVAQPALSRYLKKLEEELGIELFDRGSLPLRPTEAGKRYIAAGKKIISHARHLEKELDEIKGSKNALIRVGISPSRSPYMMPAIIESYRAKNPTARVNIIEKTTIELAELLSCGELDIVISILDENVKEFEKIELFEENVLVAVAKALSQDNSTALSVLKSTSLITVGQNQAMWQTANEIAKKIGTGTHAIECQSIESALALVKRGLGAMIVPDYIEKYGTQENNQALRFLTLDSIENYCNPSAQYKRTVCILYRKEQFLTKAEREFIDCIKSTL